MNYLCIENPGEVDIAAFTLTGASVKQTEAIGFFGSGTKYAIATLLREGVKFHVFSGENEIRFSTKTVDFRGEAFDQIFINDEPTSFTTRTGPKWQQRDAVREFVSNALDEGCKTPVSESRNVSGAAGFTRIFLEMTDEIQFMWQHWGAYFTDQTVEVVPALNASGSLFRRGVWISDDTDKELLFNYNFREISLPESRKIATASAVYVMAEAMAKGGVEVWAHLLANHEVNALEWRALDISAWRVSWTAFASYFHQNYDCVGALSQRNKLKFKRPLRILWVSDSRYATLTQINLTAASALAEEVLPYEIALPSYEQKEQLQAEITLLQRCGIEYPSNVMIKFGKLSLDAFGLFDKKNNCVVISEKCDSSGNNLIRKVLLEEWTHAAKGVDDHTVEQQHEYLNLISSLITKLEQKP